MFCTMNAKKDCPVRKMMFHTAHGQLGDHGAWSKKLVLVSDKSIALAGPRISCGDAQKPDQNQIRL